MALFPNTTTRLNYCDEKCFEFTFINIVEWLVFGKFHFEIRSRDFAIMKISKMSVFYCFSAAVHDKKGVIEYRGTHVNKFLAFSPLGVIASMKNVCKIYDRKKSASSDNEMI
jgi:hypothetical protein